MTPHPVQLHVEPSRMDRVQVIVRLTLLVALGAIGCSAIYWVLYLALPLVVALLITRDGPARYLTQDGPVVVRIVRWFAGAYAYLWLLTDALPDTGAAGPVRLEVEVGGQPDVGSALSRWLTSLPGLVLLVILSVAASLLWIMAAISVLATQRVPAVIADFIAMKLRFQFRLIAYHLSLTGAYPSLADLPPAREPRASHRA